MICHKLRQCGQCLNDCSDGNPCEAFRHELAISMYSKKLFGKDVRFSF